jgi:radical SAM protein with 4Fe4S-binding SPASM domain
MHIIRSSAENWNKFGWYESNYTPEINQIRKWHIMPLMGWTPSAPKSSGVTNFDNQRKLKYSVFNIKKSFSDVDLIWNTASEGVVALSQAEIHGLADYLLNYDINSNNLELLQALFDLGVLVFAEDEEFSKVHFTRKRSTTNTEKVKSFVILPTTQCNARCFYCFSHKNIEKGIKMTLKTADEVLQFICSQVKPDDEVVFRWYGGEPLMAVDIIDYIIDKFNEQFENKIKYHSIVTSNGSLLTDEIIEKATTKWNLRKIHFTLDGFQTEHDKRKDYFQKEENQYDLLFSNIEKVLNKGIYTTCRLNLDRQNVSKLDNMLSDLEKFKGYNHFFVHIISLHAPEITDNIGNYVQHTDYNEFYGYVYGLLLQRGFIKSINRILPNRMMTLCSGMLNNFVLINADGNLFRCEKEEYCQENSVGNCKTGIIHNNNLLKWLDTDVVEECKKCKFLPICQGGCRFFRRKNDINLTPCTENKYISKTFMDLAYKWFFEESKK